MINKTRSSLNAIFWRQNETIRTHMILFRQGCHFDFAGLKMARYGHANHPITNLKIGTKYQLTSSFDRRDNASQATHP